MLDTKSKSRYRQGILAMLAVLCLCSVGMLSTYRLIAEDMEQLSSRQNVTAETYYSFSKDLCQGIYFLYNEYSKETDKADILNDICRNENTIFRHIETDTNISSMSIRRVNICS